MGGSCYRRQCSVGRRSPRGLLRYTDDEWAAIVRVAATTGMRPGAWAQQVAHDAAVQHDRGSTVERAVVDDLVAELRQYRRVLTNIGGNLNQLVRTMNATGTNGNLRATETVLRLVRNVVHGTEELVSRIRAEVLP